MVRYLIIAFFLITINLATQERTISHDLYTVLDTVFIPPTYYVGDLVELRLVIKPKEGLKILRSRELANQGGIVIQDIQVQTAGELIKIFVHFISFFPGGKTLPPIPLGDIVLNDIRIFTSSTLDDNDAHEMITTKEPLLLPQTELYCILFLIGLVLLPLLSIKLWTLLKFWLTFLYRQHKKKVPWRCLQRDCKNLQQKADECSGPEFYTRLVQVFRTYLSRKLDTHLEALTAKELERLLLPLILEQTTEWIRLLRLADAIRFDGQEPSLAQRIQDLDEFQRAALNLESQRGTPC